jgi:hypothetical protein
MKSSESETEGDNDAVSSKLSPPKMCIIIVDNWMENT